MTSVRIVVVGLHRMTAELVKMVYDQHPETRFVGSFPAGAALRVVTAEHGPDLLITTTEAAAGQLDELMLAHPRLTLLAVDADGRTSSLIRLRPHRERLGALGEDTLLGAARAAVALLP